MSRRAAGVALALLASACAFRGTGVRHLAVCPDPAPPETCTAPPAVAAETLEETAESLALARLWGLDCAAEARVWRAAARACRDAREEVE